MFDPIERMGGGKLKDRIVALLTVDYPLPAKQINNHLKHDFQISITHQAVHKAIREMVASGILIDDNRQYKINVEWLNRIDKFAERIRSQYTSKHALMEHVKVISFDLDGCLSDNSFDELVWRKKIPEIYAGEKGLSFEKAFEAVTSEYKRLWGKVEGWRDVEFWFRHFGLKTKWAEVVDELKKTITHYGDVIPVLKELKKHYMLIIISHADRKFLNLKLSVNALGKFFDKTYSTTTDFDEYKKTPEIFLKICTELGIEPSQMVHVGDSLEYDYRVPISIGIRSYVVNRMDAEKEQYVVRDLFEFRDKLLK